MSSIKEVFSKSETILVFGGGITGTSLVLFCKKNGKKVILVDAKPQSISSDFYFNDSASISEFPKFDLLLKSPGINPGHKILQEVYKLKIPIYSEMDLAYSFFRGKIIGITGTDGKSTTTALTGHLISAGNPKSRMGGNIGRPFIEFCDLDLDYAILELSSYQLEDSNFIKFFSSALLNIAPDHLERHKTMDNYINAKLKIADIESPDSFFISNRKMEGKIPIPKMNGKILYFGWDKNNDAFIDKSSNSIRTIKGDYPALSFPLKGDHNLENLAASILLAETANIGFNEILKGINSFSGLSYRFQVSHTFKNTIFINDSKSTNLHSMLAGLKGFSVSTSLILILGGRTKKESLAPLLSILEYNNIRILLYGEAAMEWGDELKSKLNDNLIIKKNLEEAVIECRAILGKNAIEYVVFSPACASFDQYKNFEERGEHFNKLVEEIIMKH